MNKRAALLIIYIGFSCTINAQVNDAGLWATVTVQKQLTTKLSAELQDELRFNENISEAGQNLMQAGLEYEWLKGFRTAIFYRFSQRRRLDDSYALRHRLFADISYRRKFGKFQFILRERIQSQVSNVQQDDFLDPEYYQRTKLTIRLDLDKKYRPFIAGEIFYQLNNSEGNEIDNVRYSAGVDYEFNKRHSVNLYYMVDREMNVNNALTSYIAGIGYTYSF